ncbi:uncharacterized membrane protein YcaP (DUF421 family) [Paenibacillus phyllosphaerae]|uniref:Uncharacterized membrane protein YcaP (DUF421 family) n=1 Tax=Paenibacillus phyllosphaerae TaxID=274593 RepID=A0A7W5B0U5_9BACL|nr:DUF421 domain-containing protein [Paenibacillus phyllosphaerae]MBB3112283.1 uncharacterized membrane protein YcaP (DUF421 family) [Paenibacillus phyllosphaerae]
MSEHIQILIRSISAFALLLIITRLIGKQTLSNMNIHDFVTAVILGAISANFAFNEKINPSHLLISLAVFTVTSWLMSVLTLKSRRSEKLLFGKPSILIEGGKLLEGNMKKSKYTLGSLNEMLREKDIFDIAEVEYAVLENNGKLSVLKKKEHRTLTLQDFLSHSSGAAAPAPKSNYPVEFILEGKLIPEQLKRAHLAQHAIEEAVRKKGHTMADVFYAVQGTDGGLYFDFYDDKLRQPVEL